MASFPQKTSIATAVTARSEQDISCQHITSTNFMELNLPKCLELVPQQSININMRSFARFDPLVLPTYGTAIGKTRAFFVPFRTVMPSWNDFINDTPHSYDSGTVGIPQSVPTIKNSEFVKAFISLEYDNYNRTVYAETTNYTDTADFVLVATDGSIIPYNFTTEGKKIYKLLRQLGYGIDFSSKSTEFMHSALPLFSLIRIYIDYYYPSQYAQNEQTHRALRWLTYNNPPESLNIALTYLRIREMFKIIENVAYDSDYFTSAWDNPASPNNNAASNVTINDTTTNDQITITNTEYGNKTPVTNSSNSNSGTAISQFAINALRSLTDYMKRHQIVGARSLDRFLARWGVTLPSEKLNRSVYVGDFTSVVQFGDVTSTADTSPEKGTVLGGYAGKGILDSQGTFNFSTDEFGMFIILQTINPRTSYYQGSDRMTMHRNRLDFYTPEFDNLGVQALATRELYCPLDTRRAHPNFNDESTASITTTVDYNSAVFGFTPRYAEYKVGRDMISGDYVLNSVNTGMEAWHLFRDVNPFFEENGVNNTKHDINFIKGIDSEQYSRIFHNVDNTYDHIFIMHIFDIKSSFPGKSLFDTYEFKDEEKSSKVSVDTGGVKAN